MRIRSLLIAASLIFTTATFATGNRYYGSYVNTYKVTITNITKGIILTPVLAATHKRSIGLFEIGEEASPELAALAEGGAVGPLQAVLESVPDLVTDTEASAGLLMPGASVEIEITANPRRDFLSLGAMLLPTNDSFVALDTVALPRFRARTYLANAYDAGSEPNDELCANIPGPQCMGAGNSPDEGGEGYVYPSPGIHGEADNAADDKKVTRAAYDWRGSVAQVTIERIRTR